MPVAGHDYGFRLLIASVALPTTEAAQPIQPLWRSNGMKQSHQVRPPQAKHIKAGPLKAGPLAVAALTGLLIVPLSAHAQSSLNLYGLIDTGVSWVSTGTDRSGILSTGVASTSRLGFRGAEDLGNGLRAVFDLESALIATPAGSGVAQPTGSSIESQRSGSQAISARFASDEIRHPPTTRLA